jgi:alpha-galactosidase
MSSTPSRQSRRRFLRSTIRIGSALGVLPRFARPASTRNPRPETPRAGLPRSVQTPYNGRGLTPDWGLNTYYAFGVDGFTADTLLAAAQAMRDNGLWQAGYDLIVIDDGWASFDRDADGDLQADSQKFPDGIAATVDQLHKLGFAAGIYGDLGTQTCQGRPGSYQSEQQDAQWFAAQGFDYVKMD